MSNEVVRYDNRFNDSIMIKGLDSVDWNLTMGIISKLKDKGTDKVSISFNELKRLSNILTKDDERVFKQIDALTDALQDIKVRDKSSGNIEKGTIFPTISIDKETRILTVRVNSDFAYLFNELTSYTKFELQEFTKLKSKYAKACYRMLKQYKTTGWWEVSKDDFISLLEIPKTYTNTNINQRVLKPIREELSPLFEDFTISTITDNKKRGHPIIKYKFIWTPRYFDLKKADREKIIAPAPDPTESKPKQSKNAPILTKYHCRFCGQELYKIYNQNTRLYFYGHNNFATGKCKRTSNDIEKIAVKSELKNLKKYEETPSRFNQNTYTTDNTEPSTDASANKGKLNSMIDSLFKIF